MISRLAPLALIASITWGTFEHSYSRFLEKSSIVEESSPSSTGPPVLLLSLDTVRPDHLSLYGYPLPTTPNLDKIAQSSIVYDRAYSSSSWTLPAHASIFTGLYPIEHGSHYPTGAKSGFTPTAMDDQVPTLAGVLGERGYTTVAISANRLAVSPDYGMDRGFQHVIATRRMTDNPMPFATLKMLARSVPIPFLRKTIREHENATTITDRGRLWIETNRKTGRPFFLFLNYLDPHTPYIAPEEFDLHGEADTEISTLEEGRVLYYGVRSRRLDLSEAHRAILTRYYDREIAYMDDELGRLFRYLDKVGLLDTVWIFVVSDHGEFLGEHQRRGHGKALYEEVTRAVLMVRPPGGVEGGGRRVDRLASTAEIPRMVSEALGFEAPPTMLRNRPDSEGMVISEKYLSVRDRHYQNRDDVGRLRAIRKDGWKWIVADPGGTEELYCIESDPWELSNVVGEEGEVAAEMRELYARWLAGTVPPADGDRGGAHEATKKNELRALGYLD